jgi:hypothetical protein
MLSISFFHPATWPCKGILQDSDAMMMKYINLNKNCSVPRRIVGMPNIREFRAKGKVKGFPFALKGKFRICEQIRETNS